jgi:hypothetical protein
MNHRESSKSVVIIHNPLPRQMSFERPKNMEVWECQAGTVCGMLQHSHPPCWNHCWVFRAVCPARYKHESIIHYWKTFIGSCSERTVRVPALKPQKECGNWWVVAHRRKCICRFFFFQLPSLCTSSRRASEPRPIQYKYSFDQEEPVVCPSERHVKTKTTATVESLKNTEVKSVIRFLHARENTPTIGRLLPCMGSTWCDHASRQCDRHTVSSHCR